MIHIDPFYIIPICIALIVGIIFIIKHNKKIETGKSPKQSAKTNINAKRRVNIENIENALLKADLGTEKTAEIISKITNADANDFESIIASFLPSDDFEHLPKPKKTPHTIIFVGVNGVGKTTSVGKLAFLLSQEGANVVLGAADTFRAAAADQLETWQARSNSNKGKVSIVRADNTDPASVAFDASKKAVDEKADYLLIDTAGRMQNNSNLLDELKKIVKTTQKNTPVDEIYLVMDATVGQSGIEQAIKFKEAVEINGLIITKLDGSAKGGIIFKLYDILNVPVKYIGVGEGANAFEKFDSSSFTNLLLK